MIVVTLPRKHAEDWYERCGLDLEEESTRCVGTTARTITLELGPLGLKDLIDDAEYYADCMGPDSTGDIDYRPAARRCFAALSKQIGKE